MGRVRYLELVEPESELALPKHPLIAGTDAFIAERVGLVAPSPEFPRSALRPPRRPLAEVVTCAADEDSVARAYLEQGYSMCEIATHLGCGIATVHRRVSGVESRSGTWKTLP
jgi:hypothetical protein